MVGGHLAGILLHHLKVGSCWGKTCLTLCSCAPSLSDGRALHTENIVITFVACLSLCCAGGTGMWSEEGCALTQETSTHVTCACNHLSSFAAIHVGISLQLGFDAYVVQLLAMLHQHMDGLMLKLLLLMQGEITSTVQLPLCFTTYFHALPVASESTDTLSPLSHISFLPNSCKHIRSHQMPQKHHHSKRPPWMCQWLSSPLLWLSLLSLCWL